MHVQPASSSAQPPIFQQPGQPPVFQQPYLQTPNVIIASDPYLVQNQLQRANRRIGCWLVFTLLMLGLGVGIYFYFNTSLLGLVNSIQTAIPSAVAGVVITAMPTDAPSTAALTKPTRTPEGDNSNPLAGISLNGSGDASVTPTPSDNSSSDGSANNDSVNSPTPTEGDSVQNNTAPNGDVVTFAGKGTGAGQFTDARYIAVDGKGNIYISDYSSGQISRYAADGTFQNSWKATRSNSTGPHCLAADATGNVYACDFKNIRKYNGQTGALLSTLVGGKATNGMEDNFNAVKIMPDGSMIALSLATGEDDIVFLDAKGKFKKRITKIVTSQDSQAATIELEMAADDSGNIFVASGVTNMIYHFGPDGKYIGKFGGKASGANATDGTFLTLDRIATDTSGRVYANAFDGIQVFDKDGHFLKKIAYPGKAGLRDLVLDSKLNLYMVDIDDNGYKMTLTR
jgi:sugar lactone lactonase YvrE